MSRIILLLAFFSLLAVPARSSFGVEIIGPDAQVIHDDIVVSTGLDLDEKNLSDLKNGISKEITFNIDLFRVWRMWPDEFIIGKKLVRTLRCDPVKKEFAATSFDGTTLVEKRFKKFESMIAWALTVRDITLARTKDLELSEYFVKITVESHFRRLPPVISDLLILVPERDFKLKKNSRFLSTGEER